MVADPGMCLWFIWPWTSWTRRPAAAAAATAPPPLGGCAAATLIRQVHAFGSCLESFPVFLPCLVRSHLGRSRRLQAGARSCWTARCDIGRTGPGGATCQHGTGRCRIDCSGPGGATVTGRSARPARAGRRRVDRPGLLRVASQDVTILMSAHAPPPGPIRARV